MFKDLPKNCVVVGGFSESHAVLEGLADELTEPHNGLFSDAVIQTAAEHLNNPNLYPTKEMTAVGHSYGVLAVERALQMIGLCGPEPTPLYKQFGRASRIAFEQIDREDNLRSDMSSFIHPAKELAKHPIRSLQIPMQVRKRSTSRELSRAHDRFPDGRMLIQVEDDSFGFTRPAALYVASLSGVYTKIVDGKHNSPLYRPKEFVGHIRTALEEANS